MLSKKVVRVNLGMKELFTGRLMFFLVMTGCLSMLVGLGIPGLAGAGKLKVATPGDLINADPAVASTPNDRSVIHQVFDGLFEFDLAGQAPYKPVPRLVEKYEISDDGMKIRLQLRQGIQFHHGYGELTSDDVLFSLKRHLDPKERSRASAQFADVESIEALDKYTVLITLKVPSAISLIRSLAWQSAGFILSRKAKEKLGDKIGTTPIGTGPYYFDRWDAGEKIVLKKFDQYWGTPAKFDSIEFWVVPEETVALGALERGDLDAVPITQAGSLIRAKAIKDIDILAANGNAFHYQIWPQHNNKPMDDIRVRRALAHALDLDGIAERLGLQKWPSPLPSAVFSATDEFWKYEYDIQKAKQLLAEAGYPNGFELRLIYSKAYLYEELALELANCWKQVVDVKMDVIERAVYYKRLRAGDIGQHIAITAVTRFSPFLYSQFFVSGGPRNYGRYANPKLDEAILKAKTATTEEESLKWWREFQRIIIEDLGSYYPGTQKSLAAISKDIGGVVVTPYLALLDLRNAYRKSEQ